jgi:Fe-S cluster biogenesis protein NfuA
MRDMRTIVESKHEVTQKMAEKVKSSPAGMKQRVQDVVDKIRPLLQADGGDIELVDVQEQTGVVKVRLQGACRGCPSAAMTLKMGVERHLKEHVPEVRELVNLQ